MKLRYFKYIRIGALIFLLLNWAILETFPVADWYVWLMLLALVGYFVFELVFWRCPHCKAFLYRNRGEYCQYCGEHLYDQ